MNYPYLKNPETDIEKIVIESPRCRIEPFRTEGIDFEDLAKAFCEANKELYMGPYQPNSMQQREYIEKAIQERKDGNTLECFVFNKATDKLIGSVGLVDISATESNLGLWIRKELHRMGYGTEIYRAMIDWVKQETNIILLKHIVRSENIPSIRFAEYFGGELQEELTEQGSLQYYIYLK